MSRSGGLAGFNFGSTSPRDHVVRAYAVTFHRAQQDCSGERGRSWRLVLPCSPMCAPPPVPQTRQQTPCCMPFLSFFILALSPAAVVALQGPSAELIMHKRGDHASTFLG